MSDNNMNKDQDNDEKKSYVGFGVGFGLLGGSLFAIVIGFVFGSIGNDSFSIGLALWPGLGMIFGIIIGAIMNKNKKEEETYKDKCENYEVHSMKGFKIIICAIMLVAIILGVYGQSIAYYISDYVEIVSPLYCLTVLTVISMILFLITPMLIYRCMKRQSQNKSKFVPFIIVSSIIGISVSIFSFIATVMWWG